MRGEGFVSRSSAGSYLRGKGVRIFSQLALRLDEKVREILEAAIKRAEGNGRSTVMPQDI